MFPNFFCDITKGTNTRSRGKCPPRLPARRWLRPLSPSSFISVPFQTCGRVNQQLSKQQQQPVANRGLNEHTRRHVKPAFCASVASRLSSAQGRKCHHIHHRRRGGTPAKRSPWRQATRIHCVSSECCVLCKASVFVCGHTHTCVCACVCSQLDASAAEVEVAERRRRRLKLR